MPYNANIPQATDVISDSQSSILANFQALAPFGNGFADFPVQGAAPTLGMGDTGLYTLSYATTTANEMYIVKPSVDAPTNVPFTASSMSDAAMVACIDGWSYLPSGVLIKWGQVQVTGDGVNLVDVATSSGGPNFNLAFQVLLTPVLTTGAVPSFTVNLAVTLPNATTGNFTVICAGSTASDTFISYMVIGV